MHYITAPDAPGLWPLLDSTLVLILALGLIARVNGSTSWTNPRFYARPANMLDRSTMADSSSRPAGKSARPRWEGPAPSEPGSPGWRPDSKVG